MQNIIKKIENQVVSFCKNLQEKDKKYYEAIRAIKLRYGGIKYISSLYMY